MHSALIKRNQRNLRHFISALRFTEAALASRCPSLSPPPHLTAGSSPSSSCLASPRRWLFAAFVSPRCNLFFSDVATSFTPPQLLIFFSFFNFFLIVGSRSKGR
ncbi:unnamed protein product [Cuscuta europaea]|uniref:Uncharacterized protein n=1 Tax=Cuscuta europaea TaxID=41803 RepID=A0A9P0YN32_CUSEU|nr:unnamed protein product [Cuscuta europaea]